MQVNYFLSENIKYTKILKLEKEKKVCPHCVKEKQAIPVF